MDEANLILAEKGIELNLMRVRAFPFGPEVEAFIEEHDTVFMIEQNRDGQMRQLLVNELEVNPRKLAKVVHYDGTPISARFIVEAISDRIDGNKVVPFPKVAS
jgi:2-oxoglutarate ferredoxin oxidoreductase subunit alpha